MTKPMDFTTQHVDDLMWWLQQDNNLREYAGQAVVLHHRTFLGSGPDVQTAWAFAEQMLKERLEPVPPPEEWNVFVIPPLSAFVANSPDGLWPAEAGSSTAS